MTTRRNFLKGATATGIAFCSCGMPDAARAQQGAAPAGQGQRQARPDRRCSLALLFSRSHQSDGRPGRQSAAAGQGRPGALHCHRATSQGDGRDGDRHGGAVDQSVLVRQGARYCRGDRQGTKREIGRTVRIAAGTVRGFRLADPAVSGPRGATTGDRDQEAGPAWRRDRRQRAGGGFCRS